MQVGVVREIKNSENRVALTPAGAQRLLAAGHGVMVEEGAGVGAGFDDAAYTSVGAHLGSCSDAWASDLVVKIKEPMEQEYPYLRDNIAVHLSPPGGRLSGADRCTVTCRNHRCSLRNR